VTNVCTDQYKSHGKWKRVTYCKQWRRCA
jgi:hypothetical protein